MSSLFSFGGHGIGRGPGFHLTTHLPELYQPVEEDTVGRGHPVCHTTYLDRAERIRLMEDEMCLARLGSTRTSRSTSRSGIPSGHGQPVS